MHEIANRLQRGQAIGVGTVGESDTETILGGRLVANHEYFVKDIDLNTGRLCLGNPWGDVATKQLWECWLSHNEVRECLFEITAVNPW